MSSDALYSFPAFSLLIDNCWFPVVLVRGQIRIHYVQGCFGYFQSIGGFGRARRISTKHNSPNLRQPITYLQVSAVHLVSLRDHLILLTAFYFRKTNDQCPATGITTDFDDSLVTVGEEGSIYQVSLSTNEVVRSFGKLNLS